MVRTKADAYTKVSVKAQRKTSALKVESSPSSSKAGKTDRYAGGNPYCPRPTPSWQKPITNFFSKGEGSSLNDENGESVPGCSKDSDCTPLNLDVSGNIEPCCSEDTQSNLEIENAENVDPSENEMKETNNDEKE